MRRRERVTATRPVIAMMVIPVLLCAGCSGSPAHASASEPSAQAGDGPTGTPLPTYAPGSTSRALAPGFPTSLIPVPEGATIVASSVQDPAHGSSLSAVTLNLSSTMATGDLADFYSKSLTSKGFAVVPNTTTSALTSLTTFRRTSGKTPESVVVGIFDNHKDRLVTISGRVLLGT